MRRLAAIDVGTNSTRLLVAEPADPLRVVVRRLQITRLGKGVDATGHLDDEALERTLACIEGYAAEARSLGAERLRVAATSAVRDARDRQRFVDGVRERIGVDAEVPSGAVEAATAFAGATAMVHGERPYCVLDIGGGSTELIVGTDRPEAETSRQLGCVRLTERALHGDPPSGAEIRTAVGMVDAELEAAAADVDTSAARTLVGVAGTVTTLGLLHLGLPAYLPEEVHGTHLPVEAVRELTQLLAGMTSAERAQLGPMSPGREDVIVAGALILGRVMDTFGFPEVLVSDADGLEGLVLQMLDGTHPGGDLGPGDPGPGEPGFSSPARPGR